LYAFTQKFYPRRIDRVALCVRNLLAENLVARKIRQGGVSIYRGGSPYHAPINILSRTKIK
jgi:hypothetical protein